MKQALVLRCWEDGTDDLWIPRQRYETLEQASTLLNDAWNQVLRLIDSGSETSGDGDAD